MTASQSVIEHIAEFRRRLIWVCLLFVTTFFVSLYFVAPLYRFLTTGVEQTLVVLGPNDILWVYVTIASVVALTITLPFMTYQIWAYVRPALKDQASLAIQWYIPAIFVCFVSGLAFGFYIVVPALLEVLLSLGEGLFVIHLTADHYIRFVLHVTLPIALMFELPVMVAFLTRIRLITPMLLRRVRRYAIFVLLVIAVCLTPADFVSDLVMFIPLFALYEVSIVISQMIYHRQQRKEQ